MSEVRKRDREQEDSEEETNEPNKIFSASKKTLRSPEQRIAEEERRKTKNNINTKNSSGKETEGKPMEALKEVLLKEMKEMKELMKIMVNDTAELKEELKEIKKEISYKEEKWEEEKKQLSKRIENLEDRAEKEERKKRKNNIVVKGIQVTKGKEKEQLEAFLKEEVKVNAKILKAYQTEKEQRTDRIVAEVESWSMKQEIMTNKFKLRNTKIYIDNDLTVEERRIQKEIRSIAREEKGKGKKVKIGYQKITIGNEEFRWNKEEQGVSTWTEQTRPEKK